MKIFSQVTYITVHFQKKAGKSLAYTFLKSKPNRNCHIRQYIEEHILYHKDRRMNDFPLSIESELHASSNCLLFNYDCID